MGAVTTEGRINSIIHPKPIAGEQIIEFLVRLLSVASDRLLLVWDRSPIHQRRLVREYLEQPRRRGKIRTEYFESLSTGTQSDRRLMA